MLGLKHRCQVHTFQVPGAQVSGSRYQVHMFQVPGAQVSGSRYQVCRFQVSGARYQVHRFQVSGANFKIPEICKILKLPELTNICWKFTVPISANKYFWLLDDIIYLKNFPTQSTMVTQMFLQTGFYKPEYAVNLPMLK